MASLCKFKPICVYAKGNQVRLTLDYEGEGLSECYNPDDPKDVPLLRYSVELRQNKSNCCDLTYGWEEYRGWLQPPDSCYCTQLPATAPRKQLIEAARFMLSQVADRLLEMQPQKRVYELLSWTRLCEGKPSLDYGTFQGVVQ